MPEPTLPAFSPPPRPRLKAGPAIKILYFLFVAALLASFAIYAVLYTRARNLGVPESDAVYCMPLGQGRELLYIPADEFSRLKVFEWLVVGGVPLALVAGLCVAAWYVFYEFWCTRFLALLNCRCPLCLVGPIHSGWYRLHKHCPHCGASFNREYGYLVGALYFGYLLGVLMAIPGFVALLYWQIYDWRWWMALTLGPALVLGPISVRLSRSMWMHLDHAINPWKDGAKNSVSP